MKRLNIDEFMTDVEAMNRFLPQAELAIRSSIVPRDSDIYEVAYRIWRGRELREALQSADVEGSGEGGT